MYRTILSLYIRIGAAMILCGLYIFLAGCVATDLQVDDTVDQITESEITFAMQIPGSHKPSTRSLFPSEEEKVKTVDVMVFDKDGDFSYIAYAKDIPNEGVNNTKTFTVTLTTGTYDLMIFANCREWIKVAFGGYINRGTSREDIEKSLLLFNSGKWNTDPSNTSYIPIPMWGQKKNVNIDPSTSFTGQDKIKMTRMLSRIDVTVDEAVQPIFKLKEVYLYNTFSQGLVIPDADPTIWDAANDKALKPSLLSGWGPVNDFIKYENDEIGDTDIACRGEIYTFEAREGSSATYTDNTFIVVGGEYQGELSYYRLDFVKTTDGATQYLPILRNHLYDFNITAIGSKGFSSHELAARSLPMNIEVDVTITDEGEIGNYVYDGQYYLGTDKDAIEFWAPATSSELKVTTDYPNGWTYKVNESPDGRGNAVSWLTISGRTNNGVENTDILSFNIDHNNSSGDRTAYIILTSGKLSISVAITQYLYYIESVTVFPTGDIPGSGGVYTFTITGSFDDIAVQARDCDIDAMLASGIVPGSSSQSTGMIKIPPHLIDNTRTIAFEYYDPTTLLWLTVKTSDQHGFGIVSTHQDGDPIATVGEEFPITVTGSFPTLYLRAIDQNGNSVSSITTILEGAFTGTESIIVNANNGTDRTIRLQWSADMTEWYDLSSGLQAAYNFTVTTTHVDGNDINGTGETFIWTVTGNYPKISLRAITNKSTITKQVIIEAGTTETSGEIRIRNNGTPEPRYVILQYSSENGTTWSPISSGNQTIGNYELNTGRMLAQHYVQNNGTYPMTWAEAMGIDLKYNTEFFQGEGANVAQMDYSADKLTGCNAYYENENKEDLGLWKVPTVMEGMAIANFLDSNPEVAPDENVTLWLNTEGPALSETGISSHYAREIRWSNFSSWVPGQITPKTGTAGYKNWVRCVRWEEPQEKEE